MFKNKERSSSPRQERPLNSESQSSFLQDYMILRNLEDKDKLVVSGSFRFVAVKNFDVIRIDIVGALSVFYTSS